MNYYGLVSGLVVLYFLIGFTVACMIAIGLSSGKFSFKTMTFFDGLLMFWITLLWPIVVMVFLFGSIAFGSM